MEMTEAVTDVLIVAMTCGIPLLGLTLRFCVKPLLETYIRLREVQGTSPQVQSLSERVAYLERTLELRELTDRSLPTSVQPLPAEPPTAALVKQEQGLS
jgi:hypothetical protein